MPMDNQGFRFDVPRYMQSGQRNPMPYPSPYFDLASFYQPPTVKELFRWCRYYFKNNGLVHSVVFKMAEYPVTDIIFESPETDVEEDGAEKLEEILREDFDIKSFLIEIGLDRFAYGNAFATIYFPFVRYLICPLCGTRNHFGDFKGIGRDQDLDFINFEFKGRCPDCKKLGVTFKVEDVPIKQARKINLVRFNPDNIDIETSSVTGITNYYYSIPNKDKKKVVAKDPDTLKTMPWIFIQAIKERKKVKLNRSRIFHFKRADISDGDDEWGMPLILPVLKPLFYIQVLNKVQESIAMEHLVPLRILFPADNQSSAAPHMTTGLGHWRARVEEQIRKWKRDPNHIVVLPVPLGSTQIGGDGKMLLLAQELRSLQEQIVSGMTVPQEFVFGGLSWSGSSISLRMLENHFLVYRRELLKFLEFVSREMAKFLGVKPMKIRMQEFKMADDIQRKQLVMDLNRANKVSDTMLLKEVLGMDVSAEVKQMIRDVLERYDLDKLLARQYALPQSRIQGMSTEAEAEAQERIMERQQVGDATIPPGESEGAWADIEFMSDQRDEMQDELDDEIQAVGGDGSMADVAMDPKAVAARYAQELLSYPEDKRAAIIQRLQSEAPEMASLIIPQMKALMQSPARAPMNTGEQEFRGGGARTDMRPLPEHLPPRRDAGKAVV